MEMDGEHVININELVISMTRGKNGEKETGKPLIQRINIHIRDKPENAFLPYILSIGPYNCGAPVTNSMQLIKYEFLNHIVNLKHEKGLLDFLEAMKQLDKKVKSYYAEEISMDKNDFLKMLLLDGCFVLICLNGIEASMPHLQESNESNREIIATPNMNDAVIKKEGTREEVKPQNSRCNARHEADEVHSSIDILYSECCLHDLLLLENQIPFIVIQTIYELIAGGNDRTSELVENVVESVEDALSCYPKSICKTNRPKNFHHLLHLCYMYFKPCWAGVESDRHHLQPPPIRNLHHLRSRIPFEGLLWRRAIEYHQARTSLRHFE